MKLRSVFLLITMGLLAGTATATQVQGSLSYDGLPVSATFSSYTCSNAMAYSQDSGLWVTGNTDLAAGTYVFDDLTPGSWSVTVIFSTEDCANRVTADSGDLKAWDTLEVSGEETITQDLTGFYAYRVTTPYDSADQWPGTAVGCPHGAPVPRQFTFALDPVPRADRFQTAIWHYDCDGLLQAEEISFDGTSIEIEQETVPGEEFIRVLVTGISADNLPLTIDPAFRFPGGGSIQGCFFYLDQDNPGDRPAHPTNSLFVPQVAHLPGAGSTFWTSDLIVTNPGNSSTVAKLTFTPRGTNGLGEYLTASLEIPAGGSRVLTDVLANTIGTTGAGSLEVSPMSLEVTSRISTPAPAGGSYGQGFPVIASHDVAYIDGPAIILGTGGVVKGQFRSNLALVETWGETTQVIVRLWDRDGSEIGSTTVDLPPFGNTQINDLVGRLGGPSTLAEAQVTVTVHSGKGRVGAVLSVVDNTSQDPTVFPLVSR